MSLKTDEMEALIRFLRFGPTIADHALLAESELMQEVILRSKGSFPASVSEFIAIARTIADIAEELK